MEETHESPRSSESADVCYICLESEPVPIRSPCACTDRHVHFQCLGSMCEQRKSLRCPVCQCQFVNVRFDTTNSNALTREGKYIFALLMLAIVTGFALVLSLSFQTQRVVLLGFGTSCATWVVLLLCLLFIAYWKKVPLVVKNTHVLRVKEVAQRSVAALENGCSQGGIEL